MIVTFWPSSRRLAISPPQESATSSGCGATKTWAMAGRVYRRSVGQRPGAPALVAEGRSPQSSRRSGVVVETLAADQRDEHARAVRPLDPLVALPDHDEQVLAIPGADRDDHPTAVRVELLPQRSWDPGGRGGDDDPRPRRALEQALASIPGPKLDAIGQAELLEPRARLGDEVRLAFDRRHPPPELCEDRRLVSGSCADLEDAVPGPYRQELGHSGDDVGLTDRLAGLDRERLVGVGLVAPPIGDKQLARDCSHRLEDALVTDPPGPQLIGDHRRALGLEPSPAADAHEASIRPGPWPS